MKLASSIVLLVLGTCGLLLYLLISGGKVDKLETESYKILLQFASIAIFGQIIAILIANNSRKREEAKARDSFRREIITRLNKHYVDCKKLRRVLRSKSERVKDSAVAVAVKCSVYDDACSTINDVQLNLEIVCKDIESGQALFQNYDQLYLNASSMEEYLNRIVDEFEHLTPKPEKNPPVYKYADLPCLSDLVGPYKTSNFRTGFVHPYYKALDELKAGLLYVGKNHSFKRPAKKPAKAN